MTAGRGCSSPDRICSSRRCCSSGSSRDGLGGRCHHCRNCPRCCLLHRLDSVLLQAAGDQQHAHAQAAAGPGWACHFPTGCCRCWHERQASAVPPACAGTGGPAAAAPRNLLGCTVLQLMPLVLLAAAESLRSSDSAWPARFLDLATANGCLLQQRQQQERCQLSVCRCCPAATDASCCSPALWQSRPQCQRCVGFCSAQQLSGRLLRQQCAKAGSVRWHSCRPAACQHRECRQDLLQQGRGRGRSGGQPVQRLFLHLQQGAGRGGSWRGSSSHPATSGNSRALKFGRALPTWLSGPAIRHCCCLHAGRCWRLQPAAQAGGPPADAAAPSEQSD